MPALHELARAAMRLMFSGDASQWDRALQMPHYNTRSMPAISLHTGMHLIQARPPAVLQKRGRTMRLASNSDVKTRIKAVCMYRLPLCI